MEDKEKMTTTGKGTVTYIFSMRKDEMEVPSKVGNNFWQILPCFVATSSCIPFGLMLGWPSPSNPILLASNSEIPITIDQSAMIAGFLMIGNSLGTPISARHCMPVKYGILLGMLLMISGWIIMWQAVNLYGLLGSRLLVGFGHGFVAGQVKIYINQMCHIDVVKATLVKLMHLQTFAGLIMVYTYGAFVNFRQTSIVSISISLVLFCVLLFLPSPSKDRFKINRELIGGNINTFERTKDDRSINIEETFNRVVTDQLGLCDLFKNVTRNSSFRTNFLLFVVFIFCQQGSGVPATIIYTQILFTRSHCPNPEFIAIGYVIVFFIANVIGVFISPKYNKRKILLFSSVSVSIVLVLKILVINYNLNEIYWSYTSVAVMFTYLILHTIGLGNVPFTLIEDFFPLEYKTAVVHFFIMLHSILALIITKIFQLLITVYLFDTPFYLFLSFSLMGSIFAYYFLLPEKTEQKKIEITVKS